MTDNLFGIVLDQYAQQRQTYAEMVYDLLRVAEVSNGLHYNNLHMIIVDEVQVFFAAAGVEITFDDPYGDSDDQFITIAAPYTPASIAAVVQGLVKLLSTTPAPVAASDTPRCCGKPMRKAEPETWFFPGEPMHVEQAYHCPICCRTKRIETTEPADARTAAQPVAAVQAVRP